MTKEGPAHITRIRRTYTGGSRPRGTTGQALRRLARSPESDRNTQLSGSHLPLAPSVASRAASGGPAAPAPRRYARRNRKRGDNTMPCSAAVAKTAGRTHTHTHTRRTRTHNECALYAAVAAPTFPARVRVERGIEHRQRAPPAIPQQLLQRRARAYCRAIRSCASL